MYYIRFLKQPSLSSGASKQADAVIKALITLTTDLGESTCPLDVDLRAALHLDEVPLKDALIETEIYWTASSHAIPLQLVVPSKYISKKASFRLFVDASSPTVAGLQDIAVEARLTLPYLIATISAPFGLLQNADLVQGRAQRCIPFCSLDLPLSLWEDTGPSIDKHVWDAGLALAALLSTILSHPTPKKISPRLEECVCRGSTVKAIELGTGIGVAGLSLAHLRGGLDPSRATTVLLTDVESARPCAELNIQETGKTANVSKNARIAFASLDWELPLPVEVTGRHFDLVLVSDCTYNPDSGEALVSTLLALARANEGLLVVVAAKTRHASEAVFWRRMQAARFRVVQQTDVLLPTGPISDGLDDAEVATIHLFTFEGWKAA